MSVLGKFRNALFPKHEEEKGICATENERLKSLTAREYEAFLILVEGYTLKFCAEKMGVKYSTANTYQNAIYKKLGVNSRAKLIIEYKDIAKSNSFGVQKA